MGITLRKRIQFINKPFVNGFRVLKYSKVKCMLFVYLCFYLNTFKAFVFFYRYFIYALLKTFEMSEFECFTQTPTRSFFTFL